MKSGSHKDKNVNITDSVMLPYTRIRLSEVPLFTFYVVVCIEICSIEVFNPKYQVPVACVSCMRVLCAVHNMAESRCQ